MSDPRVAQCPVCRTSFRHSRLDRPTTTCSRKCGAQIRPKKDPVELFWAKVRKTDGCWLWTGSVNNDGYGAFRFKGPGRRATHVAWFLEHKEWPPAGFSVCHTCDEPRCVRVSHLFLGTHSDNMLDMYRKGRAASKVTQDMVRSIRSRRDAGELCRTIAADFGLSDDCVRLIGLRVRWKWVQDEPSLLAK